MKKNLLAVAVSSAALLFASSAWADGGPVPEEAPPPPPPAPEPAPEPAPVYEPEPAPEYHWYTTIFAGVAFGDDLEVTEDFGDNEVIEFDIPLETGYLLGWTLGYDNLFGGETIKFRPEVELSFRQQDEEEGEGEQERDENRSNPTDVLSLMGNLWIDLDMGGGFVPYAGGGVGIGWADLPDFGSHVESEDFVWQFGGGVNVETGPRTFLGVGYRYFGGDFEESLSSSDIEFEYRAHEVMANFGVRF